MEIKQVKELMAAMQRLGTTKVRIKKGTFELELERIEEGTHSRPSREYYESGEPGPRIGSSARGSAAPLPQGGDMASLLQPQVETKAKAETPGIFITSPMVGTFYSASSPEDPDFVKVGDKVEKGSIVCIIEAMKVMNEIKSQFAGQILEVLVDNGHPVEFGTKLFRIQ